MGEAEIDLKRLLGSIVHVFIKDGREIRGKLNVYDQYQNLILENAEEYSDDKLMGKHRLIFVKGGNIKGIHSP